MTAVRGLGQRRRRVITRMKLAANTFKLSFMSFVLHNYIKRKQNRRKKRSTGPRGTGAGGNSGNSSNSTSGFHDDSAIVCEILSRLPVKSLVRFKCVCKRWKLLIEEDAYFIDLHLNQSKSRPTLFFIVPIPHKNPRLWLQRCTTARRVCYYKVKLVTVDLMLEGRERKYTMRKLKFSSENTFIFGPVNGLIGYSYSSRKQSAIRICNIGTQEVSPWIESELSRSYEVDKRIIHITHYYEMGFDPAAKKHKVLCILHIHIYENRMSRYESAYEVLTVGDIVWRRVEPPPFELQNEYFVRKHTIYLNGFIYYFTSTFMKLGKQGNDKLVAFDVGAEKFTVITVPNFILNQPMHVYSDGSSSNHLIELESRLALLSRMSDYSAKLWVFDGNNKERNHSTSGSSNQNWTEVTIELPYLWRPDRELYCFHSVAGTNQIVIESHSRSSIFTRHLYNWKTKSCKKIEISGRFKYYPPSISRVSTLVESLFHVR